MRYTMICLSVLLVRLTNFFFYVTVHHRHPRAVVSAVIVQVTIRNPANGSEITRPFLVDGGNEAVPVLLHPSDVAPLNLTATGTLSALMADRSSCEIRTTPHVDVELTFDDGSMVSAVLPAVFFPPAHTAEAAAAPGVMAEDERILGYDALRVLGLKQDYKTHRVIRALRRM